MVIKGGIRSLGHSSLEGSWDSVTTYNNWALYPNQLDDGLQVGL